MEDFVGSKGEDGSWRGDASRRWEAGKETNVDVVRQREWKVGNRRFKHSHVLELGCFLVYEYLTMSSVKDRAEKGRCSLLLGQEATGT